jgi:hypothetical protein
VHHGHHDEAGDGSKWHQQKSMVMIESGPSSQASKLCVCQAGIFPSLARLFAARHNGHWCHFDAEGNFDGGIGYMPPSKRQFTDDEELEKKDHDHRPTDGAMISSTLRIWRLRRKRVLIGIFALYLLYLFVKYIPTDVPPVSKRIDNRFGTPVGHGVTPPSLGSAAEAPPPRMSNTATEHYFDGPIKFYNLGPTLGFAAASSRDSRSVLFAASSLKSASHIIPLACDMSKQNRNKVHFAIMGREGITIEDIKQMNGISDGDCAVLWHDARPDYAPYSSDFRMELSARSALGYIHKSMRLQAVLTDTSNREDDFFTKAITDKTKELGITMIELPANAVKGVQWMMKLDSASLSAVNDLEIEILVHAPAESSGSLIRLLKSLKNAEYFGFSYPRLTIELPPRIDIFTINFLSSFRWPPDSNGEESKLTLRHRVNPKRLSPVEATILTIESYYPAHIPTSHVLILTSQAELAPSYYHYLLFSLLEYKYSESALESGRLLGISLELPTHYLNGSKGFSHPSSSADDVSPLFLWQAPNSNAALYFGDKWAEFHSFLSNRFAVQPRAAKEPYTKLVSEKHPAWMEYLLELVRARGYAMLYPAFASYEASAIVTVHKDLYQPPEEFLTLKASVSDSSELDGADSVSAGAILDAHSETPATLLSTESTTRTTSAILPLLFPNFSPPLDSSGAFSLPRLADLQALSFTGEPYSLVDGGSYAEEFAQNYGGCKTNTERVAKSSWSADDLFCLDGQDLDAARAASAR